MTKFYKPKILVLEGLWGDLVNIIDTAGGDAYEETVYDAQSVLWALKSTDWDGIVLTGGSDINPRLYNEKPHKEVYGVDPSRDDAEYVAMEYAQNAQIPVLGICRGSQIMCAFRGGKLRQHIEGHRGGSHPVVAESEARTFRRAINSRGCDVISLHHQCVRRPGRGMRIAARALDGTPEAIESKDGLWLGVQFHPEMSAWRNSNSFAIFQWLVQTAARNRGLRARRVRFRDIKRTTQTFTRSSYSSGYTSAQRNRQAGTRSFHEVGPYTSENPCPCDMESCTYGSLCGRTFWDTELKQWVFTDPGQYEREKEQSFEGTEHDTIPFDDPVRGAYVYTRGGVENIAFVCPTCAMLFDFKQDRDDHVKVIHQNVPTSDVGFEFERRMEQRYPELLPPTDSPAWDDVEPTDDELTEIDRGNGKIATHVLGSP